MPTHHWFSTVYRYRLTPDWRVRRSGLRDTAVQFLPRLLWRFGGIFSPLHSIVELLRGGYWVFATGVGRILRLYACHVAAATKCTEAKYGGVRRVGGAVRKVLGAVEADARDFHWKIHFVADCRRVSGETFWGKGILVLFHGSGWLKGDIGAKFGAMLCGGPLIVKVHHYFI